MKTHTTILHTHTHTHTHIYIYIYISSALMILLEFITTTDMV